MYIHLRGSKELNSPKDVFKMLKNKVEFPPNRYTSDFVWVVTIVHWLPLDNSEELERFNELAGGRGGGVS